MAGPVIWSALQPGRVGTAYFCEAGWLSLPTSDRVVFSPEMSQQAERHFATTFFAVIQSARAALAAWPRARTRTRAAG